MKWFKHDSNANADAKLRKVRAKYGMEGYGLYWLCLEHIAAGVEAHNLNFELEHDAELLAIETGIHIERVEEMMLYMLKLNLFENSTGKITCLKMIAKSDDYIGRLARNQEKLRSRYEQTPESLRTNTVESPEKSGLIEQNRIEQNRKNPSSPTSSPTRKKSRKPVDPDCLEVAEQIAATLRADNVRVPESLTTWANDVRLMRDRDGRSLSEILRVFHWANRDPFWSANILSTGKLRKQFDQLRRKAEAPAAQQQGAPSAEELYRRSCEVIEQQRLNDSDGGAR